MTNNLITLTIPNDDHVALRAFGKALEEMALAHGAEPVQLRQTYCNVTMADEQDETLRQRLKEVLGEPEVDTTAQQVESLGISPELITALAKMESSESEQPAKGLVQTEDGQFNLSTGEQVDSTGTPWDERIHSTSKALNADGTWRLRRKPKDMDEGEWADYVAMIKADLQYPVECGGEEPTLEQTLKDAINVAHRAIAQEFGTGVANAAFTGDRNEPPVTPPGDDFHTDAGLVTEQTVAGIPPIPVPPPVVVPPVPAADDEQAWNFPKLMKFLTERHGKIDVPTVNQLLAVDGLAALTDLNVHPDKIGPFVARVKAHLGE